MTLTIHIRPRHITADGLARLRVVLEANPGPDLVEVRTYTERFRLPLTVDASRRALRGEAAAAIGGTACAIVTGLEPSW